MQRLKYYLGIKQNIKEVTEKNIDQDDATTNKQVRNPLAVIEKTREQFHADQKRIREDRIKGQLKMGFPMVHEPRVHETEVDVNIQEQESSIIPNCFKCKVVSVSSGYMASFYVMYVIRREYSKALPSRRKNAYVQAGILTALLFGLTTCLMLDIDVYGKWGRKFDKWILEQDKHLENRTRPASVGGLPMAETDK